jgi:ankyrin repeat protein
MHNKNITNVCISFFDGKKQYFPQSKIDLEKIDKNGSFFNIIYKIIWFITRNGYFRLFEQMLAEIDHFCIDFFINDKGETPLFIASQYGHQKTMLSMTKQINNWTCTATLDFLPYIISDPLHNLALFGHENLIFAFYNAMLTNSKENNTIFISEACLDVILERDFNESNFIMEVTSSDLENMTLMDYVDEPDNLGWSPLHWAACLGKLTMLQKIFSYSSDIHVYNHDGMTALHLSCIKNHPDCVKFLLDNGSKMLVNDHIIMYCNHPLHMAAYHGSTAALQILLDHIRTTFNDTDRLLEINYTDENLETALHFACDQNHCDCVGLLVTACVDVNKLNIDDETALDIAKAKNHTQCVDILTKYNHQMSIFLYS